MKICTDVCLSRWPIGRVSSRTRIEAGVSASVARWQRTVPQAFTARSIGPAGNSDTIMVQRQVGGLFDSLDS